MREHDHTVAIENVDDLNSVKEAHNVPQELRSCHTAIVDGYIVEGHVPSEDVQRMLDERPDILGLAVAGMPIGSPGMEVEGVPAQDYEVIAFKADGTTEVFARH